MESIEQNAQLATEKQRAADEKRERARLLAQRYPMHPVEIVHQVELTGHRLRILEGRIEVSPGTSRNLTLELEMQIIEHALQLGKYLTAEAHRDWRTIVELPNVA